MRISNSSMITFISTSKLEAEDGVRGDLMFIVRRGGRPSKDLFKEEDEVEELDCDMLLLEISPVVEQEVF